MGLFINFIVFILFITIVYNKKIHTKIPVNQDTDPEKTNEQRPYVINEYVEEDNAHPVNVKL